jgi:hypothetical protein
MRTRFMSIAIFLLMLMMLGWPMSTGNVSLGSGSYSLNMYFDEIPRPWWNSNYEYRSQINITARSSAVPANYSISLDIDHAGLVSAGKAQIDGEDVRMVHWNGTTWLEIDQALDTNSTWNSTSTKIWFKTRREILTSDNEYYLHYGNPAASNPPANKSRVFTFFDDFETGNLAKWTVQIDGLWSVGTDQASSGTYSLKADPTTPVNKTQKWMTANGINETDMVMEAHWRISSGSSMDLAQGHRTSPTAPINQYETLMEGSDGWDIAKLVNGTWTEITDQPAGQNPQNDVWTRVTTINVGSSMKVMKDGMQIVPASGWTDVGNELTSGSVGFRIWNMPTGQAWWIDDVLVRRYVDPEPTASLGPEVSDANVQIIGSVYHVKPDGSDPQEILTSAIHVIDSNTPNPFKMDIGIGTQFDFTDSDPRVLRLEINVTAVNGSERFVLAFGTGTQPTNLTVPAISSNVFFLHDTIATGIAPPGRQMNTTAGDDAEGIIFDTPGQSGFWYRAMWSSPVVSILSPTQGQHVTGTYDVLYSISASVTNVSFEYDNGLSWVSAGYDEDLDGTFEWDTCSIGDRATALRATANDILGNATEDVVSGLEIDCTPPSIQILQPTDFSILEGNVTITYSVDPDAVMVDLRYDNGSLHSITTEAPPDGTAVWNVDGLTLTGAVLRATASDEVGLTSEDEVVGLSTSQQQLPSNKPPTISGVPDIIVHYDYSYNFDLTPYIEDEDTPLDQLVVWTSDSQHIWTSPANDLGLVMNYPQSMLGQTVLVTIWVTDGTDTDFQVVNVTILDDYPPEKVNPLPDVSFNEDEIVLNVFFTSLNYYFQDVDDNNLYFTSGNDSVRIRINMNDTVDMWAEENWSGFEIITIRATDPTGALVEDVVIVQVNPVNDPPVIGDIPDVHLKEGESLTTDISEYITDIDSRTELLVLTAYNENVIVQGLNLTMMFPSGPSERTIALSVSDGIDSSNGLIRIVVHPRGEGWNPWLILLLLIAIVVPLAYYSSRRRRVFTSYLLREDGLLIQEISFPNGEKIPYGLLRERLKGSRMREVEGIGFDGYRVDIIRGGRLRLAIVSSRRLLNTRMEKLEDVLRRIDSNHFDKLAQEGTEEEIKSSLEESQKLIRETLK